MVRAVATGAIQREVARQAYEFEKGLQSREIVKVGVNKYTEGEHPEVELHEYDERWAKKQIEGLKALERERDSREAAPDPQGAGGQHAQREKRHARPGGVLPGLRHGGGDDGGVPGRLRGVGGTEHFLAARLRIWPYEQRKCKTRRGLSAGMRHRRHLHRFRPGGRRDRASFSSTSA